MFEWFEGLGMLDKFFAVFALIGSLLFIIRLVLLFSGMGGDDDSGDISDDGDVSDHDSSDSDVAFNLLSFQGLSAFFMMFGLVGLAMSRGSGFGALPSMSVATGAGLFTVWIISKLFRLFGMLQHSGTLNLKNAIGQEGRVYLTIKDNHPGQVEVPIQGHLKVMNAVSEDGQTIPTDTQVVVVKLISGNVLVVEKL